MMCCTGFTTDGEWNSLRTKGNTRPLSIFLIRADARTKFARTGITKMINMITLKGMHINMNIQPAFCTCMHIQM